MNDLRIKVMISSRCEDKIRTADGGSVKITKLRQRAKAAIAGGKLFGYDTFDCWIHEGKPALSLDAPAWDKCLAQVENCHILLVLYDGSAGSGRDSEDIGICHAEMMAALNTSPGKVRLIDLSRARVGEVPWGNPGRNQLFADYLKLYSPATRFPENDDEALTLILEAVQDSVIQLTERGSIVPRSGRYATGAPVEWSRLDYAKRKTAIETVLRHSMHPTGSPEEGRGCVREIAGVPVYFACHAVPAAMSVPAARELVGKPFLRDHEILSKMPGDTVGPVHLIGCHKSVTENQAVTLLGFPDATILTPEFGIYVADDINKIQLVLLANCRDESTTRNAVKSFQAWLGSIGEAELLARRARGRKAIVSTIAEQLGTKVSKAGR